MIKTTYNDWTLVSLSPLPLGLTIVCLVVLVAVAFLVIWSYRHDRRRLPLSLLRLFGALLIAGFLIEPALQLRVVRKVRNRLAVVIDRSLSMSLAADDDKSRYDHVLAFLEESQEAFARLGESHVLEWFDLEGPVTSSGLAAPPTGARTDLLAALERSRDAGAGRPLSGIVLISDGADNVDLEGLAHGELSPAARDRLKALRAPVSTLAVSRIDRFKDVAITEVEADDFAFVHNTIEIAVRLEAEGLGNLTVPITLRREADVIAVQEVALREGEPTLVRFKTKPDQIGEFVYSVTVPIFAGEAVTSNNQQTFVLRVIRDKIRVLQVAGRPSWDERFLRQYLKENPNIDLISFFILRTPADATSAPDEELSLIPFPVDKLFTTDLRSFDVVIFQNFDYRPYQMVQYLPNIREAVRAGLGFVMVGGDQSFGNGGYVGTAIEEIVPVRLDVADFLVGAISPQLTEAGRSHPVTDLAHGSGSNERLWSALPRLTSLNRSGGLVAGATALATTGTGAGADGKPTPLVAAMDVGQGRSLAIATDALWRWRFDNTHDGGVAERAYHRFWSNALHWLVRDPEHSRVQVLPEKRRVAPEAGAALSVLVRGRDYQPVKGARVRLTLESTETGMLAADDIQTGETGLAHHRYATLKPGAFRVVAKATLAGEDLGVGSGVFLVEARSPELSRGAPRPDLLAAIARETDGKASKLSREALAAIRVIDPEVVEVDRRRNVDLWDNLWALLAALLLLTAEWALRRHAGYV